MAEPETLKWIESFDDDSIFYDIGSNIGGFSFITTKLKPKMKIFSFEPNINNYFTQKKSIIKNNFNNITCLNVALNDKKQIDKFLLLDDSVGNCGNFGIKLNKELEKSEYLNPFNKKKILGYSNILGLSLDSIIYELKFPIPKYIKIDVDGNESLIINGANKLLKEKELKEIFIEIDDNIVSNNNIYNIMKNYNFNEKKIIKYSKNLKMILFSRY